MNNVLIIHGGGLVDPSKEVIRTIAYGLRNQKVYDNILLGRYSFMSMYDPSLWFTYDENLDQVLKTTRGTYFGTCRGIDLTNTRLMASSLYYLDGGNVKTVIVCGGDGSSRNCAEISEKFQKHGISIIFATPLTVDGINGGVSIGVEQATRESVRQIENLVATSLETRDNGEFSVVAVELSGRNRDDILANVLQYFWRKGYVADCKLTDILLKVVPANYETDENDLIETIKSSRLRTLLLVSEGAEFKIEKLEKMVENRKVRTLRIGHLVQSNGLTTEEDMKAYSEWIADVVNLIAEKPNESYCIVNDGISRWRENIDYYAKLNPRDGQKAEISKGLEKLIKNYMV